VERSVKMFEVRSVEGKLLGSYLIKDEAIGRMNEWPHAHYVVEVYEVRQLVTTKEQGGSSEANKPEAPEAYF